MYWYLYLTGPGSEDIKFDLGGLDTAMEGAGGPGMRRKPSPPGSQSSGDEKGGGGEGHPSSVIPLPATDRHMASWFGREMSADAA